MPSHKNPREGKNLAQVTGQEEVEVKLTRNQLIPLQVLFITTVHHFSYLLLFFYFLRTLSKAQKQLCHL